MIVVVAADTPVTVPNDPSTVAIDVLLLLQLPPVVGSLNVIVAPVHTGVFEVIGNDPLIVTTIVAALPQPFVYCIVAVPGVTPLTTPLVEPTVATAVLLLLHVPPLTASANVVFAPTHADTVPVMLAGATFTVIVAVVLDKHPVTPLLAVITLVVVVVIVVG